LRYGKIKFLDGFHKIKNFITYSTQSPKSHDAFTLNIRLNKGRTAGNY